MKSFFAALFLFGASSATDAAEPVTIRFDGAEAPVTSREFTHAGAQFSGGRIATEGAPGLYASGAFYYDVSGDGGEVRFATPTTGVEFFYVHGFGHDAGTARAFDAAGNEIASASSRKASYFGATANVVAFDTTTPIAKITFDGGLVDNFRFVAATAAFVASTALNGAWVNTSTTPFLDGQGLLLEYMPENRVLFAAWFTYGDDRQRWLTAQGTLDGDDAQLAIVETAGGVFNAASSVGRTTIGTMTVSFTSCDSGSVTFSIPDEAKSGTFAIRRLRSVLAGDGSCNRIQ